MPYISWVSSYINFLLSVLLGATAVAPAVPTDIPAEILAADLVAAVGTQGRTGQKIAGSEKHRESQNKDQTSAAPRQTENVPEVPFYSQLRDISEPKWKKLGCGIADLAMIIEFYNPGVVSVDALLQEGRAAGAFLEGVGWKHRDLALLSRKYGLDGTNYDWSHLKTDAALAQLAEILEDGPVIASVYYTFNPRNPIPHLVVINGIDGGTVYYNDPAAESGGKTISAADFMRGWKKKLIVLRPA